MVRSRAVSPATTGALKPLAMMPSRAKRALAETRAADWANAVGRIDLRPIRSMREDEYPRTQATRGRTRLQSRSWT